MTERKMSMISVNSALSRIGAVALTLVIPAMFIAACGEEQRGEPYCGDGVLDDGEECDDGDENNDTEPGACRVDCALPFCGDGICDLEEHYDDCVEDCPGVGEPCDQDDPNACAGVKHEDALCVIEEDSIVYQDGYCTIRFGQQELDQSEAVCAEYDSLVRVLGEGGICVRSCEQDHVCREGYSCWMPSGIGMACLPQGY